MTKKNSARRTLNFLKDCDDMIEIITGKRIKDFVKNGLDIYGDDIKKRVEEMLVGPQAELEEDNPYKTLDCRPDADDIVVKGKFRQLVKKYHPDIGSVPNPQRFQKVIEAYNAIDEARRQAREKEKK